MAVLPSIRNLVLGMSKHKFISAPFLTCVVFRNHLTHPSLGFLTGRTVLLVINSLGSFGLLIVLKEKMPRKYQHDRSASK